MARRTCCEVLGDAEDVVGSQERRRLVVRVVDGDPHDGRGRAATSARARRVRRHHAELDDGRPLAVEPGQRGHDAAVGVDVEATAGGGGGVAAVERVRHAPVVARVRVARRDARHHRAPRTVLRHARLVHLSVK